MARRRGPASPDQIVSAAERCFLRWGLRRTRMEDVASEADVARPTIYHHFASKEALVEAVIVRRVVSGAQQVLDLVPLEGPSLDLLTQAMIVAIRHPGRESLAMDEEAHWLGPLVQQSPAIHTAMVDYWRPYLDYAKARGELRAGVDFDDAVWWLTFLLVVYTAQPLLLPHEDDLERIIRTFVIEAIVFDNPLD